MYYMRVSTRHRDTQHLGSIWCRSERVLDEIYRPLHTHPYLYTVLACVCAVLRAQPILC